MEFGENLSDQIGEGVEENGKLEVGGWKFPTIAIKKCGAPRLSSRQSEALERRTIL